MPDCENFDMQQLRRMQELQQMNDELVAQLAAHREMLDHRLVALADLEKKCQALAAENENLKYRLSCCQDEKMVLQAQMEVVYRIFPGRQGGGCGGCH